MSASASERGLARRWLRRLALLAGGSVAGLLLAESVLSIAHPPNERFLVQQPNLQRLLRPDSEVLPGVTGESRFETSSWGLRSDEWGGDAEVAFLALGGSTTECRMLDQQEAWPRRVQTRLNRLGGPSVWVGNAGKSGRNTRSHVLQIEHLPAQLPRLRAVVALMGGNDLLLRLRRGDDFVLGFRERNERVETQLGTAFYRLPESFWAKTYEPRRPFYKKTGLWRLAREAREVVQASRASRGAGVLVVEDGAGRHLVEARRQRVSPRPLRDSLPDLTTALGEYRRSLRRMAELAQAQSLRLILLTQPTLWRGDLPPELDRLLWIGHGEEGVYYSNEALGDGIARYNRVMLEVCEERRVECVDLARLLPRDTTVFYDDMHFNEAGADRVAETVASRLAAAPPFGAGR